MDKPEDRGGLSSNLEASFFGLYSENKRNSLLVKCDFLNQESSFAVAR